MKAISVATLATVLMTLGSCDAEPASTTPCNTSAECSGGLVCVHASTGEVLGTLWAALKADCTCDYNPVCEAAMKCSAVKCSCDPECNHGDACGADGHCDTWCPTGVDPDCAGSPDDGTYCSSSPTPPVDASTGDGDVTGTGAQPDPVKPTYAGTCAPSPSSAAPGVGASGGDPGACADPGAKTKASCKEDAECGPVLTCMKPCPSCEKTCNLPCGTGDEGDAKCASYDAGTCPEKTCSMCFPVCSKPPTRCTPR